MWVWMAAPCALRAGWARVRPRFWATFVFLGVSSLAAMAAWWASSPFSTIGIYLGGTMWLCENRAFDTTTWVRVVLAQGWNVIPIYVGRQLPCTNYKVRVDSAFAFQHGAASADDA